jgi:biotin carboxyl carrier protein
MIEQNGTTEKDKYIVCTAGGKKVEVVNPLGDIVKVKGKKLEFSLVEEGGGFSFIVYKNKKYQVEVLERNQNKVTVMVNGVWHTLFIETPISYKRRKALAKSESKTRSEFVVAPMPGKILDVLVELNSEIKEGEPLIILEAMKMQNEILSQVSGVVRKIHIKQNDSVMKDDVMLEIERS